jgi:hypothetical protein
MPWPPQDDTPPKPPLDKMGNMRRDFSPLVKLAMRMGWIVNLINMTPEGEVPPMEVMAPFTYIAAYEENEVVYVFGVVRGLPMSFVEPKTLFPSDGFIGRLKTL